MTRAEFLLRLAHAIIRTTDGRLGSFMFGGFGPGNEQVLISPVYAELVKQAGGPVLTFPEFKRLLALEMNAGTLTPRLPEVVAKTSFVSTDPAHIARSGVKFGKTSYYALDVRDAQALVDAHKGTVDNLDTATKRALPRDFFRTKDPIAPKPAPAPGIIAVPPASGIPSVPPTPTVIPVAPGPVVPEEQPAFANAGGDGGKLPPPLPPAGFIPTPLTANEAFMDAMIRQQVYLLRLSSGVQDQVRDLLNKTEADLAANIRRLMADTSGIEPKSLKRLQVLMDFIKHTRGKTWDDINALWLKEIGEIAKKQPEILSGLLRTVSPVHLDLVLPSGEMIKGIATSTPFEGKVLKEWADTLKKTELAKISDQLKIGMVQGEGSEQLARRIVGSFQLGGVDGVTELSRRNAVSITRTAVNAIMNMVNREFFTANQQYFQGERFVATLDSRTTPVCRSLDGKVFPVGKGPIPPLHFNCRSIRVVTLDGEALGSRPARNFTAQSIMREFLQENGLDSVPTRDDLPRGYKTAFDKYFAKRARQLTGQVAADIDYASWLKRQPHRFQDDILGVTKAKLFRTGRLSLDKFVDAQYNEVTLRDLAKMHADIFRAAGLDPADFL